MMSPGAILTCDRHHSFAPRLAMARSLRLSHLWMGMLVMVSLLRRPRRGTRWFCGFRDGGLRKAAERPDQTRRPPISRRRERRERERARETGALWTINECRE
jgi:hypothetical protein